MCRISAASSQIILASNRRPVPPIGIPHAQSFIVSSHLLYISIDVQSHIRLIRHSALFLRMGLAEDCGNTIFNIKRNVHSANLRFGRLLRVPLVKPEAALFSFTIISNNTVLFGCMFFGILRHQPPATAITESHGDLGVQIPRGATLNG